MSTENTSGWSHKFPRITPTDTIEDRIAVSEQNRIDLKLLKAAITKQGELLSEADSAIATLMDSTSLSHQLYQELSEKNGLVRRQLGVTGKLIEWHKG